MKRSSIYSIALVLIVLAAIALFFHHRNKQVPIPPLKERQGPISTTSEWLNTRAAIKGLEYKLRRNSRDTQSKLLLALAYMQEARVTGEHPYYYPAALQMVEEVIDQSNTRPEILYEATVAKAMIQLSLHQFEEALQTAHKAREMNDKRAALYGVLCDAHVELGNYEEAIKMADKMVSIRPDLKSYSRISYLREIHGDMPGAIEAMEMAARAGYPGLEQTAWTLVTLGELYEKTGDLQKAELQYRKAMADYPQYAFALGGLGRVEAKKKNDEEAIQYFTQAANILPEFSFQEELAQLYKRKGEERKAETSMLELLSGLKEDQEAGHVVDLELAKIYLELDRDHEKALQYAEKEYKRRPDNIDVCKTLAAIYYHKQEYGQAEVYFQKASRTSSQDASLLCLGGLLNFKQGNRAIGQDMLRKSFAIDPFQNSTIADEGKRLLNTSLSSL